MRREQQLHPPCVPPPKQAEVPSAVHRESAQGGGPGAVQVMVLFKLRVKALTRVISSHRHLEFLVNRRVNIPHPQGSEFLEYSCVTAIRPCHLCVSWAALMGRRVSCLSGCKAAITCTTPRPPPRLRL